MSTRLSELEQELEEEYPLRVQVNPAEYESSGSRCPPDKPYTITGFARYSDDTTLLPVEQKEKLASIVREILASNSGTPTAKPVKQVYVLGHADLDLASEARHPGFLQLVSERRAQSVMTELKCRLGGSFPGGAETIVVGRGARDLAVRTARTEAERRCNRRVEITLVRTPQPQLTPEASEALLKLDPVYHLVLQGTSGQYDQPLVAATKAKEIAVKAILFLVQKQQENRKKNTCGIDQHQFFYQFFFDALQGTANKFSDPDIVIQKAWEIMEHAGFGRVEAARTIQWKFAPLSPPPPMAADCELGQRLPGGPPNHVICRTHDHILDTTQRVVIAHDVDEYKKRLQKGPAGSVPRRR
jgi:outer membrane protein OmpA-like peptidoglycan-associated protein